MVHSTANLTFDLAEIDLDAANYRNTPSRDRQIPPGSSDDLTPPRLYPPFASPTIIQLRQHGLGDRTVSKMES
jgi:hypothetical protein